jgi:hypothetical protein
MGTSTFYFPGGNLKFIHPPAPPPPPHSLLSHTRVCVVTVPIPFPQYERSKLLQIVYSNELARRLQREAVARGESQARVVTHALHPGVIITGVTSRAL